MNKQRLITISFIFIAMPLTIIMGVIFLDDRQYYFISLFLIIYSLVPFFLHFEGRKPQARELMAISVMAALVVAGRAAFFMIPQFKPVVALVIVSGMALGRGTGFLVGSIGALASNFLFGMGPFTPWQMFSTGTIGYLAGALLDDKDITKASLCIFGGLSTFIIYGGIMDLSTVLAWAGSLSWKLVGATYLAGLPFNLMHSFSTVVFLYFLGIPMIEKLNRIKTKYGLNLY